MLKRPSSRRRNTHRGQIELNLVPILDTMVTLIAFLLFTMSFLSIVSIETPFPQASIDDLKEKLKEKPLQLTLSLREGEAEIWSPFEKIKAKKIPNITDGAPDTQAIHNALVEVKQKYPTEVQIVFAPYGGINYDVMISTMDAIRSMEATDPPIYVKNQQTGVDEAVKSLFPGIVFGNLLGEK